MVRLSIQNSGQPMNNETFMKNLINMYPNLKDLIINNNTLSYNNSNISLNN